MGAYRKPQFGTVTKAHRLTSFLNSVKIQPNLTEKRKPSLTLDYDSDLPENCGLSRFVPILNYLLSYLLTKCW